MFSGSSSNSTVMSRLISKPSRDGNSTNWFSTNVGMAAAAGMLLLGLASAAACACCGAASVLAAALSDCALASAR